MAVRHLTMPGNVVNKMNRTRQIKIGMMKSAGLFLLIAIGLLMPSFVVFYLETSLGNIPCAVALRHILERQFAPSENLFILALIGLVPFLILSLILFALSHKLETKRFWCLLVFGLCGILALMIPAHISVWRPIYTGNHMSSTAVIAFVFIPIYCTTTMLLGMGLGWLISLLPFSKASRRIGGSPA